MASRTAWFNSNSSLGLSATTKNDGSAERCERIVLRSPRNWQRARGAWKKRLKKAATSKTAAAASALKFSAKLAAPIALNRNNLHEYRSTIKDLRNVLELGHGNADERFIGALRETKDAIGEWHDWEELFSLARESLNHSPGCKLLAQLKDTADNKLQSALALANKLRKTYFDAKRKERARGRRESTAPTPVIAASRLLA